MQVLVFKVSKDYEVVPDRRTMLEVSSYSSGRTPFVDICADEAKSVMVDRHVWPIRKFSNYECDPSSIGMPIELRRGRHIDTYIAVDPELEKFLSIEYNHKINEISGKLNAERDARMASELEVEAWWSMPWYKRAWSAIFSS